MSFVHLGGVCLGVLTTVVIRNARSSKVTGQLRRFSALELMGVTPNTSAGPMSGQQLLYGSLGEKVLRDGGQGCSWRLEALDLPSQLTFQLVDQLILESRSDWSVATHLPFRMPGGTRLLAGFLHAASVFKLLEWDKGKRASRRMIGTPWCIGHG